MPHDYSTDFRQKLAEGKTTDDALVELRAAGASVCESIFAVEKVRHCGLAEAKKTVHFSPAWSDMREQHERFHAELDDAFQRIDDVDA